MNVLIVEDDQLQATMIASLLEASSHSTAGMADSLKSAIAVAEAGGEHIDLALVDISLGHCSTGYSVAARLKAKGIPSVFVTGSAPSIDFPELALGCLSKPFDSNDLQALLATVESILIEGKPPASQSLPASIRIYSDQASREEQRILSGGTSTHGSSPRPRPTPAT